MEPTLLETKVMDGYTRYKYEIKTTNDLSMPYYVLVPKQNANGKAAIAIHGHGSDGKEGLVGNEKEDLKNILDNCSDNSKLEIIVQGSVELMKSRNRLFTKKESKKLKNNTDDIFLIDKKNKRYPIHKSLSNEEIIISNSEDISLLNDITYLKSIGLVNFAIDGRWRDENYLNKIQEYNTAIDK